MKARLLIISAVAACVAALCQLSMWTVKHPSLPTVSRINIELIDVAHDREMKDPAIVTMAFGRNDNNMDSAVAKDHFPNFPLGEIQTIDLYSDDGIRYRLTEREWKDQVRDWLLLTVIGDSGLSAYDIGGSLFDLPPLRYGYLKASGQFDYGESRSCYIGNERVLAIVPAGLSVEAHDDALADIIDRHRKDQAGEISSVELFEYRLLDDGMTAEITRLGNRAVAPYLDPKKGYYEALILSANDLYGFLSKTDDLTYAEIKPIGLVLGGRKLRSYEFRGIGIQEVAAIWQSEQDIIRKERELNNLIAAENAAYEQRWGYLRFLKSIEKIQLQTQADIEFNQARERIRQKNRELRIVDGSGFSLDPTYDFEGLGIEISNLLSNVKKKKTVSQSQNANQDGIDPWISILQRVGPKLKQANEAITRKNIFPLLSIIASLGNSGDINKILFAEGLKQISDQYYFQAARYDGKLQGTEVGMVLFYTDLLAKIWAMDYLDSAPGDTIKEFVDDTQIKLASIYDKESHELRQSRLWFGPTDRGFQISKKGKQLFFQRVSTRVFTKGRDPLDPSKKEVQTSAFLAAPIDWWDDHYAEIARYEPEYFRLNEIMKWSLLIGFLNEGGYKRHLNFLDAVDVDRSNWFPTWAKNNQSLQFDLWDQIRFYGKGFKGTSTEAMEYLRGKLTAGGVSLAPKKLFSNRTQIAPSLKKLHRRSNINYASAKQSGGKFKTLDGVTVKLQREGPTKASIQNTPEPKLRLRARDSDLINAPFERVITQTSKGLKVSADTGGTAIGELNIAKTPNGFRIGWQARDIDAGQTLALRASRSIDPQAVIARDASVEQLFKMPTPETYAVKLRKSEKWMVLNRGGGKDSTVGGGWQSRVADPEKGFSSFQIKWVDKGFVEKQVLQSDWMTLHPSSDGRLVIADIHTRGPPTKGTTKVEFLANEKPIVATFENSSGKAYIPTKELQGVSSDRIVDIPRRLDLGQFKEIRQALTAGHKKIQIPLANRPRLADMLEAGQFRKVATEIVSAPEKARPALDKALATDFKAVSNYVAKGETANAISQLARIRQLYGPQPEIKLWEGLMELSRGRIQHAAQALGKVTPGRYRNRDAFFHEIHARIKDPGTSPQARDSLKNMVRLAKWQRARSGAKDARGYAMPSIEKGYLGFEFRFVDPLRGGRTLSPGEAKRLMGSGAQFYRQNSPQLNNLDWNVSQKHAFAQAIDMRLGKLIELPHGDIASLNPTKIIAPANAKAANTDLHLTEFYRTSAGNLAQVPGSGRLPSSTGGGGDDNEEEEFQQRMANPFNDHLYILIDGPMDG